MPNWVKNKLYVSGKFAKAFDEAFKTIPQEDFNENPKPDYCFNAIIQEPDLHIDDIKWRKDNWGVAHDVFGMIKLLKSSRKCFEYTFITAWDAPYIWLMKSAKKFPFLKFRLEYVEPYNNIGGEYCFEKGILVFEQYDCPFTVKKRLKESFKETG